MGSAIAAASFPLVHPRLLHRRRIPSPPHSCNPNPKCSEFHPFTRRDLLFAGATTASSLLPWPAIAGVDAAADGAPAPPEPAAAAAITDRVFIDFSLCPSYLRSDRTIGSSDLAACPDSEPLGRVVFGLYGKLLPITVANFKTMCTSEAYRGALVHKVLQGEYFAAGRQGRREKGEITPPPGLAQNTETVKPGSFKLKHLRPGTLSLCLSENDDYDEIKLNPSYRNVEFMVTTGPGPCPQLDGLNIVFGTVLEGLDVVTMIASIPTYKPGERIRQFNDLAEFLGDDRAQNARAMWNRPLKSVFISNCGELQVTKPSLSPSLP